MPSSEHVGKIKPPSGLFEFCKRTRRMASGNQAAYRKLIDAAYSFQQLRLWQQYDNEDGFAVNVPGEKHPLFGVILGAGGEEYGLSFMRGDRAFDWLLATLRGDGGFDRIEEIGSIGFSMTPLAQLPPDIQKQFGRTRPGTAIPLFLAKAPHKRTRMINAEETNWMLHVLNGLLKAHQDGVLTPKSVLRCPDVLTLTITGEPVSPDVQATWETYDERPPARPNIDITLPEDIKSLPVLPCRWLIGFPALPVAVEGDDRTVRAVVIADAASRMIIGISLLTGDKLVNGCNHVIETFESNLTRTKGIPREIAFSSQRLFDFLSPAFEPLGVRCLYQPEIPMLDEIVADLQTRLMPGATKDAERKKK